jgi:hypothetical protein
LQEAMHILIDRGILTELPMERQHWTTELTDA